MSSNDTQGHQQPATQIEIDTLITGKIYFVYLITFINQSNMNKILPSVLFLFLASVLSASAQKFDLDKKHLTVEYLILPTNVTLPYFNSYSTDFFADATVVKNLKLKPATINSFFQLDGYKYTKEIAEFNYSIKIDKPQILEENIIEKKETYKNTDGTSKTVIKYIATCVVLIPTTLSIKLIPYGTDVYASHFADNSDPIIYQSYPQLTRANAQTLLNTRVGGIPSDVKDIYIQQLQTEINKLKNACCFGKDSSNIFLLTVNEKDTTKYGTFNTSVSESVIILDNLKYNESIKEAREKMAVILTYWSKSAYAIASSDKH